MHVKPEESKSKCKDCAKLRNTALPQLVSLSFSYNARNVLKINKKFNILKFGKQGILMNNL